MKNKKAKIILVIIILVIIQLTLLYLYFKDDIKISKNTTTSASLENVEVSYELSNEIGSYIAKVALSDDGITVDGNGATVKDNIVTITKAGTYYVTGTISDASIQINCQENGNVQLVLDNVNITSKTNANNAQGTNVKNTNNINNKTIKQISLKLSRSSKSLIFYSMDTLLC